MITLDLFKSQYEQKLHEGASDIAAEQEVPQDQPQLSNFNDFNTPENRENVKKVWHELQTHFLNPDLTWSWLTLKFPVPANSDAVTLSPNQVWSILKKLRGMSKQNQTLTILTKFSDRNSFMTWLNSIKVTPRPQPKREVPKGQQSLDLKEAEKKSSKYKDVAVQRAMRQAKADFPTAASDAEAFAKSMMAQQDQDQKNINRLKAGLGRQRELLNKNDQLDVDQEQTITSLNKEVQQVEKDNDNLQLSVQQMQSANKQLQQTLDRMRGKRIEPAPQAGVSVATDKIPAAEPTVEPAPDKSTANIATRQDVARALQRVRGRTLARSEHTPVGATQIGGKSADVLPSKKPSTARTTSDVTDVDDISINPDVLGMLDQYTLSGKGKTAKQKDKEFELTSEDLTHGLEEDAIPAKQVYQGYVVEFNPKTNAVTISQRGQVLKQLRLKTATRRGYEQLIHKFINSHDDEKYPQDIEDRDVSLPMKKVAEGSVFGQQDFDTQMDLAKLKSQLTQPKAAQSAPVAATQPQSQPVPARLSDLQARHQRVADLAKIKGEIEDMQQKATKGGRILPRGLAADLEDYYTLADIDQYYDEIMAKYQKQKAALAQYTGMKKIINKKVTHEMRAHDLEESKSEVWTVRSEEHTSELQSH